MADFTKFRSSMGGFNRSDVTNYIERICADHQKETKRMKEDTEALEARIKELEAAAAQSAAEAEALKEKLADTETALASTESALEEALSMVDEQQALRVAAESERDEALAQLPEEAEADPDYVTMELEAYRRAEATERLSQERAARVRLQLSDLLDNVSARYEETGQEIGALTEDIRTNMKRLQDALSDLELIFDETCGRFDTIDQEFPAEEE